MAGFGGVESGIIFPMLVCPFFHPC
jgi:hypothetical protein